MTIPRIDVHAHFLPDCYSDEVRAAGQAHPDGMPQIPEWSEEMALRMMDGLGIAAAVISVSSPGVYFGNAEAARKLAKKTNEERPAFSASTRPDSVGLQQLLCPT